MRQTSGRCLVLACLVGLAALTACTAGPNQLTDVPDAAGSVAGFWRGLWHGVIAPFAFLASLITDSVSVYETHNSGGWYDFGFLFGVSIIFGGSGGGAAKRRR